MIVFQTILIAGKEQLYFYLYTMLINYVKVTLRKLRLNNDNNNRERDLNLKKLVRKKMLYSETFIC
jgi:hypothetical protein